MEKDIYIYMYIHVQSGLIACMRACSEIADVIICANVCAIYVDGISGLCFFFFCIRDFCILERRKRRIFRMYIMYFADENRSLLLLYTNIYQEL